MSMHTYFMGMSQLEQIKRAPGIFKFQEHSVASHSWKVTQIAQFLGDVEEQNGSEIDWKRLYEKAVNHDYAERFIGDIATPIKYFTPELRKMLAGVEDSLVENYINTEVPSEFQAIYKRRLSELKDDSIEGRILSVADKFDLLYEAFLELNKNTPEEVFVQMFQESLQTLKKFEDMKSVQYLLKEVVPEMINSNIAASNQLKNMYEEVFNS